MPDVRSIFISDVHLGTRACQAERLLDFLREHPAQHLFLLVLANVWLSRLRRLLGIPGYWSLAGYAKRKVKTALQFIFDFEDSVMRHVRERGMDGVICGHIHWAALKDVDGLVYANCGDWVDSCTAIVEHHDGRLELVDWAAISRARRAVIPTLPDAKEAA
jgi:UDP-2,3-diacylglucosamine pyrophosphatase LpxH